MRFTITWNLADHAKALAALKSRRMRPGNMAVDCTAKTVTITGWQLTRPRMPGFMIVAEA